MRVVSRDTLRPGDVLEGPLIIEDLGATARALAGQTVTVRPSGVLEIADSEGSR